MAVGCSSIMLEQQCLFRQDADSEELHFGEKIIQLFVNY